VPHFISLVFGGFYSLSGRVIRVNSWDEFKRLLSKYDVREMAYNVEEDVAYFIKSETGGKEIKLHSYWSM